MKVLTSDNISWLLKTSEISRLLPIYCTIGLGFLNAEADYFCICDCLWLNQFSVHSNLVSISGVWQNTKPDSKYLHHFTVLSVSVASVESNAVFK